MRVAVVYKNDIRARELALELGDNLTKRSIEYYLMDSTRLAQTAAQLPVDLIFVIGGDGTLLQVAHCFAGAGAPIMGVNLGTVGFLSSVEPEDLQLYLDAVLRQEYELDARIMINAAVTRDDQVLYRGTALNDVVIRARAPHAILIELRIDGNPHTSYRGDGVICATPTGSTAYSLSAGGPVIDTGLDALAITPICSHLSLSRPLVVSALSKLTLELDSDYSTDLVVDGLEEFSLLKSDLVQIERSSLVTNLVRLQQMSRLERIKRLMGRSPHEGV
jgi:NAD+ kinase